MFLPSPSQERYEAPKQQMEAAVAQAKKEENAVSETDDTGHRSLSLGANLLILSLLQLFFSENGFLTIQWEHQATGIFIPCSLLRLFILE